MGTNKLQQSLDRAEAAEAELEHFKKEYLPGVEVRIKAAESKAAQFEKDWYAAKTEFGTATGKLRDKVRAVEEDLRARLASICHFLAGEVEGHPTSSINYLQRIHQLTETERDAKKYKAALEKILTIRDAALGAGQFRALDAIETCAKQALKIKLPKDECDERCVCKNCSCHIRGGQHPNNCEPKCDGSGPAHKRVGICVPCIRQTPHTLAECEDRGHSSWKDWRSCEEIEALAKKGK